ncbi:MAG TPA: hypothetical protein VF791_03055 [Pyrinomonadaceae bacterium]
MAFGAAFFGADALRAGADLTVLLLAAELTADLTFDFVALRAGALSDEERFTSGFGRIVLLANVRLFAEDVWEFLREAGREGDRFTPFTIGSLMRST